MALQSGKEALQSVVLSCFSAILSGNQQQMKDAEEELKALKVTEGTVTSLYYQNGVVYSLPHPFLQICTISCHYVTCRLWIGLSRDHCSSRWTSGL